MDKDGGVKKLRLKRSAASSKQYHKSKLKSEYKSEPESKSKTKLLDHQLWHQHLGHTGHDNMRMTMQNVEGMRTTTRQCSCETCLEANKDQNYSNTSHKSSSSRHRLDFDIVEMKPTGINGEKYACPFQLSETRWVEAIVSTTKSAVAPQVVKIVNRLERQFELKVKVLRADPGGENVAKSIAKFCDEKGLIQEFGETCHRANTNAHGSDGSCCTDLG